MSGLSACDGGLECFAVLLGGADEVKSWRTAVPLKAGPAFLPFHLFRCPFRGAPQRRDLRKRGVDGTAVRGAAESGAGLAAVLGPVTVGGQRRSPPAGAAGGERGGAGQLVS
ncbi:hypothetical protein GCM10010348_62350 [Streptomyces anthocyanicus]|nr:hypothetical protein GCM10010348_62350 [Streptomyces anthocyanicus]